MAAMLTLASCGPDRPEVTIEDKLESIEGQDLTPAEVQRKLEVADTLCQTDSQILEQIWGSLTATQLRFQDFVFGTHCPERSVEYAASTGRALTAAAHESLATEQPAEANSTAETLPLPDSLTSTTQP